VRRNEIPAGAKPSGLPACVQEARVNVCTLRFPDHEIEIRPRSRRSSGTNYRRFEATAQPGLT
jgi:hypothetical protein